MLFRSPFRVRRCSATCLPEQGKTRIYPLTHLVTNAFQSVDNPGHFSFSNFVKFVSTDYYRQAIWNSIKVTIVSTILASVIRVSLAYITTNIKIFGSRVINVLIVVSMFSPPFIGAYSWILMFGCAGSVTKFFASHGIKLPSIYGFTGIMIVFTLHLFRAELAWMVDMEGRPEKDHSTEHPGR